MPAQLQEVWTSPLSRARDTAAAIVAAQGKEHGTVLAAVEDRRLLERDFGSLEGQSYKQPSPPLGIPPEPIKDVYRRALR